MYIRLTAAGCLVLSLVPCLSASASAKKPLKTVDDLRQDYIARFRQYASPPDTPTLGSLWTPSSEIGSFAEDYKARHVHDTLTIQVSVQTAAAQSGSVDQSRTFNASSAITGVLGNAPSATNPILAGQSSKALKGQGVTASNTTFSTNLTAEVIAVLPNGNLVVEAERQIFMNNQHENVTVRGMLRPGDIGPGNTVPSAALADLEIDMKGKGIISDGVRPPNAITRAVLWLIGF
jgi:flagellar L-ring protein precursor FlgH